MALKLLPEDLSDVPSHLADRYEAQAGRYWDLFYRRNTTKFFKDRHYLHKEFPDLAAGPATLLEVGCGVGNTVFPLLEINPALKIYCCDFAASAIELVRQNPQYTASGGTVQAFVADITSDLLAAPQAEGGCGVPGAGCDLATMIFVLSAIHPQQMAAAVHNVARCLRPGSGRLLFRDYAEGDLAQERLAGGDRPKRLGPNFYVRGDGTRCYYFSQPEVLALFASAGFVCDSVTLHERTVVNHKRDIAMDRRWLQAVFTLRQYQPPPLPLRELLAQPTPSYAAQQHQQPLHQLLDAQQAPAAYGGCVVAEASACSRSSAGGGDGMDVDSDGGGGAAAASAAAAAAAGVVRPSVFSPPCTTADTTATAAAEAPPSGLYGGSWLTGAAGRLASHLAAGPGQPSGRALLPETLDSADDLCAQLSASPRHHHNHHHNHHTGKRHHEQQESQEAAASTASFGAWPEQQQQQQQAFQDGFAGVAAAERGGAVDGGMQIDGGDGDGDGTAAAAAAAAARRRRRSTPSSADEASEAAGGGGGRFLESELEAEFFATVGRDSAEVVAEEVAATGAALSRVRLVDVAEVAAGRLAATAGTHMGGGGPLGSAQQQQPAPQQQPREAEVPVAAGVSFRCLLLRGPSEAAGGALAVPPATLALARILLQSPRLLAGKCALQLGPARLPTVATAAAAAAAAVLPAMAAVRGSARRVVVSDAGREGLAAAAADLRRNAHLVVIERLRLVTLDWAAAAAAASAAPAAAAAAAGGGGGVSIASGYTYVPGAARQVRDVLQMQPTGYDIVYAADPLAEVTAAAAAGPAAAAAGDAAIAAARALFQVAAQLIAGGTAADSHTAQLGVAAAPPRPGRQGLLLLVVPGAWAAVHGMGFAALAGVCGWELLVPEQLAELYGADVAAAAGLGCAALAFRRRLAGSSA